MKVKIEYEYDADRSYPFIASTIIHDVFFEANSDKSYEDAKQNLIAKIKKWNDNPALPDEEVEI